MAKTPKMAGFLGFLLILIRQLRGFWSAPERARSPSAASRKLV
jgi:hypothetical protein